VEVVEENVDARQIFGSRQLNELVRGVDPAQYDIVWHRLSKLGKAEQKELATKYLQGVFDRAKRRDPKLAARIAKEPRRLKHGGTGSSSSSAAAKGGSDIHSIRDTSAWSQTPTKIDKTQDSGIQDSGVQDDRVRPGDPNSLPNPVPHHAAAAATPYAAPQALSRPPQAVPVARGIHPRPVPVPGQQPQKKRPAAPKEPVAPKKPPKRSLGSILGTGAGKVSSAYVKLRDFYKDFWTAHGAEIKAIAKKHGKRSALHYRDNLVDKYRRERKRTRYAH